MIKDFRKHPRSIYLVRAGSNLCKIGWSTNPTKRLATVHWWRESGKLVPHKTPERPALIWSRQLPRDRARAIELALHHLLQHFARGGEWYEISPSLARQAIETVIVGLPRHATLEHVGTFIGRTEPWQRDRIAAVAL